MGSVACPGSSFEDVELEAGFPLTIMDFSRPLLIDLTPRLPIRSLAKFIFAMLAIVLGICFSSPKDHFVDYSVYRVNVTNANSTFVYHFAFLNLTQNFTRLWLTIFSTRDASRPRHYDNASFSIAADRHLGSTLISHTSIDERPLVLHYPPSSSFSDSVAGMAMVIGEADRVNVTATVTYHTREFSGIVFEWSINNPNNREIEKRASPYFHSLAFILCAITLLNFRFRFEQIGTIANVVLFFIASFCFASNGLVFHFVEQLMTAHLRAFLFYLIAYIANKHRTVLAQIAFALVCTSFALDIGIAWHSWSTRVRIMHGHDIAVHMLLACVIGSIVGAMSRSVEDRFPFIVYTILLAMSLTATLTAHDLCIIVPHFEHFIEPRFLFYGTHAIILAVLVYFHQGIQKSESEGDELRGSTDDASIRGV
jgi:hypothetical protein